MIMFMTWLTEKIELEKKILVRKKFEIHRKGISKSKFDFFRQLRFWEAKKKIIRKGILFFDIEI